MIIATEGIQGVGKSTFCKKLEEHAIKRGIPTEYIHKSSESDLKIKEEMYTVASHDNQSLIIWDRWFLSEYVFSNLLNRECTLSMDITEINREMLPYINAEILFPLYLVPPQYDLDVIRRRRDARGKEMPFDNIVVELGVYEWFKRDFWIDFMLPTSAKEEEIISRVVDCMFQNRD